QGVVHRRVVGANGVEILPEQKGGAARHRHPQLGRGARLRKGLAVGARHAGLLPGVVAARGSLAGPPRGAHLVAPMLAGAVLSALDEILRGARERVVWLAERRDAAVLVVIDADI